MNKVLLEFSSVMVLRNNTHRTALKAQYTASSLGIISKQVWQQMRFINWSSYGYTNSFIYLWLNEAKCNERDDKWFLEFTSKMIECGSVVIVIMCEAWEVCKCKDASIEDASETKIVIVVLGGYFSFLDFCIKETTLCVSSSVWGIREMQCKAKSQLTFLANKKGVLPSRIPLTVPWLNYWLTFGWEALVCKHFLKSCVDLEFSLFNRSFLKWKSLK